MQNASYNFADRGQGLGDSDILLKAAVSRAVAAVAAVIFFAAALSGCGSSSDPTSAPLSTSMPGDPPDREGIANPTTASPPMPPADINGPPLMLPALDAYATPATLLTNEIRNGGDNNTDNPDRRTLPITGFRYDNAEGPQVFVQRFAGLDSGFAAIGIWVSGNAPTINEFDHDYTYAFLGDNIVDDLPSTGMAIYDVEGDATYKGVNFFPDGLLTMDFNAGTFQGGIVSGLDIDGSGTNLRNSMWPDPTDLDDGMSPATEGGPHILSIAFAGIPITDGGFGDDRSVGSIAVGGSGFFADLTIPAGRNPMITIAGRFYDAPGDPAPTPRELAGVMNFMDTSPEQHELKMGFLGRLQP